MSISKSSSEALRKAFTIAVTSVVSEDDFGTVTDFHVYVDSDTGEVVVSDDLDSVLAKAAVREWAELSERASLGECAKTMTLILQQLSEEKVFDEVNVSKPFSFVLEDADKETLEELFIVDDDTIFLTGDLLNGMDKELDDFLEELMKS